MNKQKNNENELTEVLSFSNTAIISYALRLSKLVKAFEGLSWDASKIKAKELIDSDKALEYIQSVRDKVFKPKELNTEQTVLKLEEPLKEKQPVKELPKARIIKLEPKTQVVLTTPTLNYQTLVELAPELEQSLINKRKYWAVARKRGYKDVSLELFQKDELGFYLELIVYADRVDEAQKMKMQFFIDLLLGVVEVINYTDKNGTTDVYKDGFKREMVKTKERADQNTLLSKWLNRFLGAELAFMSEKNPKLIQKQKAEEQAKQQEIINQKIKAIEVFKLNINQIIPDFEEGKIELCEAYIELGIDQQDIDMLNTERRGFTITPLPISDEKKILICPAKLATRQEFRISRKGKIYFDALRVVKGD